MVCLSYCLFCSIALSIITDVSGAIISADQAAPTEQTASHLMRSEPVVKAAVHLGAGGETVLTEESSRSRLDMSCWDFPEGPADAKEYKNCTELGYTFMYEHEECKDAALRNKKGYLDYLKREVLDLNFDQNRPKGCFWEPCEEHKEGCYMWNEVAAPQQKGNKITGIPVCLRPRFEEGKASASKVDCPAGYVEIKGEAIDNYYRHGEYDCESAGRCKDQEMPKHYERRIEKEKKVKDADKHYIQGCFSLDDKQLYDAPRVWFHTPNDKVKAENPLGTPICQIEGWKQTLEENKDRMK